MDTTNFFFLPTLMQLQILAKHWTLSSAQSPLSSRKIYTFPIFPNSSTKAALSPKNPSVSLKNTLCNMQPPRMWAGRNSTRESPVIGRRVEQEIKPGHSCVGRASSTQLNYTTCFSETKKRVNKEGDLETGRKKHRLNSNGSENSPCGFTLHSLSDLNEPINPLQQHLDRGV